MSVTKETFLYEGNYSKVIFYFKSTSKLSNNILLSQKRNSDLLKGNIMVYTLNGKTLLYHDVFLLLVKF